ncbi:glycosyltransferase family 2 protein [Hortaea werneckii]|nr:glycosyltransferase family 2 protein [Hortaea werneckii]
MEKRGRSSSAPILPHDCPQRQDGNLPNHKKDLAHHDGQIKGASPSSIHVQPTVSRANGRNRASTFSTQLQGHGNSADRDRSPEAGKGSSLIAAPAHENLSSNNEERDQSPSALPESVPRTRNLLNAAPAIVQRPLSAVFTVLEDLFPSESYRAPNREDSAGTLDIDTFGNFDGDDEKPVDPKRVLSRRELGLQRILFAAAILGLNAVLVILSGLRHSGTWVLVVIIFFKSKDAISVLIQIADRLYRGFRRLLKRQPETKPAWILSLIPVYSESEEQIIKALRSLRHNGLGKHKQVMCIILDGKPRNIKGHMTRVAASFSWKYVNLKWTVGTLNIDVGFVDDIPIVAIEKVANAGKKDSLVLCQDLFNYPRTNVHPQTLRLRSILWKQILPQLTHVSDFQAFDLVFCTDADSTIHQGAIASLADTCLAEPSAIAACGFVFVEYGPGKEWSVWNLIQQFQYAFGQVVRRGAESAFGKVTCLPGCITMLVVRPEMAGAMEKYAAPVTSSPVFRHQVQYLGTDRRLTYSLLSQSKHLHTFFVPSAGSETVAPQSLKHYLSQRRRWGSNAYFNNLWYLFGENMILMTRLFAIIETIRLTMVYFRLANTILFLYGFSRGFRIAELLPTIGILVLPLFCFLYVVSFENRHLRSLLHKLVIGGLVTRCVSPILSMLIFSIVMKNLGSAQWGVSGVTASSTASKPTAPPVSNETHEQNLDVQRRLEEGQQIQPQAGNSDEGTADIKAHEEKDKPSL